MNGLRASLLVPALTLAACDHAPPPAPEAASSAIAPEASPVARVEPWLPVDPAFKGCAGG